jgi:hypothetical protein
MLKKFFYNNQDFFFFLLSIFLILLSNNEVIYCSEIDDFEPLSFSYEKDKVITLNKSDSDFLKEFSIEEQSNESNKNDTKKINLEKNPSKKLKISI